MAVAAVATTTAMGGNTFKRFALPIASFNPLSKMCSVWIASLLVWVVRTWQGAIWGRVHKVVGAFAAF